MHGAGHRFEFLCSKELGVNGVKNTQYQSVARIFKKSSLGLIIDHAMFVSHGFQILWIVSSHIDQSGVSTSETAYELQDVCFAV